MESNIKEFSIAETSKPLSHETKKYIFENISKLFNDNEEKQNFITKLIAAALENIIFPPQFQTQLSLLQAAYQSIKDIDSLELLQRLVIQTYFEKKGLSLFEELLKKEFNSEDWSPSLLRMLAKNKINFKQNPYIEACIENGKIYWRIYCDSQVYYPRRHHEQYITNASNTNKSCFFTWEDFRIFKDAGKRTGTVAISEEVFIEKISLNANANILPKNKKKFEEYKKNTSNWPKDIYDELKTLNIINSRDRLSQSWHSCAKISVKLESIKGISFLYNIISNTLEEIATNEANKEKILDDIIFPGISIFRPIHSLKTWSSEGNIKNKNTKESESRLWDVGIYQDLSYNRANKEGTSYEIDHIPSQSQINAKFNTENQEKSSSSNPKNEKNSYWSIYLTKELHKSGDTNGTSQTKQLELDFYSSINTYICKLKKDLSPISFLQALGAFRFLYSRMCKQHPNIGNKQVISNKPSALFDKTKKKNNDDLFTTEMKFIADLRTNFMKV